MLKTNRTTTFLDKTVEALVTKPQKLSKVHALFSYGVIHSNSIYMLFYTYLSVHYCRMHYHMKELCLNCKENIVVYSYVKKLMWQIRVLNP